MIRELDDEGFGLFSTPMGPGSFEVPLPGMLGAPTWQTVLTGPDGSSASCCLTSESA
ncbi:MAG: hypothetical protein IPJ73_03970 [Zoogloea sp.]|nr:hypothetical protein [Zoogloea sp.]